MASSTVENYVKQLYLEEKKSDAKLVSMGRLAEIMGVVPGTTTTMVKALSDSGLVHYEPREGARLTSGGEQLALHVLRRHRLVELLLVEVLGLDWSEVHEEAEALEHAISDKVLKRIDDFLNHPKFDPHGDPIPTAKGKLTEPRLESLTACALDTSLRIARVMDQNPAFLKFIEKQGLMPGVSVTVTERNATADAITLWADRGKTITLGMSAAAKIMVGAE